jgi:hypothetical protein
MTTNTFGRHPYARSPSLIQPNTTPLARPDPRAKRIQPATMARYRQLNRRRQRHKTRQVTRPPTCAGTLRPALKQEG